MYASYRADDFGIRLSSNHQPADLYSIPSNFRSMRSPLAPASPPSGLGRAKNRHGRLVILPTLRIKETSEGRFILTRKFIEGVLLYLKHWDGPICVVGQSSDRDDGNLDHVEVSDDVLPFETKILDVDRPGLTSVLKEDDVLLLSLETSQCFIPEASELEALTKIFVSEYSLKTRLQIASCSTRNPLKILKRVVRELSHELRYRRAVARADGMQCNGTPTYQAYREINKNALLFFDSRMTDPMMADETDVLNRSEDGPIRLVYSGRLDKIKGVDHLILVAKELVALGVAFEMTICGGGPLDGMLRQTIEAEGLGAVVRMAGVLDFKTELVPFVKDQTDLFVCCHRQGDPSCTYLETMSCGVPIIGYDNEALRGIVETANCGWITPSNAPKVLAREIARLAGDRTTLRDHALASLRFARQHSFEETFARRIEHIRTTAAVKALYLVS